jgi:hypothetical protein
MAGGRGGRRSRQVVALGQVAGEGRGGVQRHHHGAGLQLGRQLGGEAADQGVGHGQDHHVGAVHGGVGTHAGDAQLVLQPLAAGRAGLDVTHGVGRALQVLRQAHAHLAAGAEQRDGRLHDLASWPLQSKWGDGMTTIPTGQASRDASTGCPRLLFVGRPVRRAGTQLAAEPCIRVRIAAVGFRRRGGRWRCWGS